MAGITIQEMLPNPTGKGIDTPRTPFHKGLNLPQLGRRGFDIITNSFFVEESFIEGANSDQSEHVRMLPFHDFDSFYSYLKGDIYNNACYTFCPLSLLSNSKYWPTIDLKKLFAQKSFVKETIRDYSFTPSQEENTYDKHARFVHKQCKQWEKKFNACRSFDELFKMKQNYMRSKLSLTVDVSFFFFQYIYADITDKQRFSTIMQYMSSGFYPERKITAALCSIFDPDDVIQSFQYSSGSKSTIYKKKRNLKEYVRCLKNGEIRFSTRAFFDPNTCYYCEETQGYPIDDPSFPIVTILRSFSTFQEFIAYRGGNLTHCDLSSAPDLDLDFPKYMTDQTTKLPLYASQENTYSVEKFYCDNLFYVTQRWYDKAGNILKEHTHRFQYFFDFVSFLENDLSGADLTFCDGLEFLEEWDAINWADVSMKSELCERFNIPYDNFEIRQNLLKSFYLIEENETDTDLVLRSCRDSGLDHNSLTWNIGHQRVQYISDLHLMHRISNARCRSTVDVTYVIQKLVDSIASEASDLLLIAGDVTSDFELFKIFIERLAATLGSYTTVVCTLGNHELWSFSNFSLHQIVEKYRDVLDHYGMYLLHNDILYKDDFHPQLHMIKYHELCQLDDRQIRDRLGNARYIIFGGLGFSGYNKDFNANHGIYGETIDRIIEVQETYKFEALYNRLRRILRKDTIILTHTPKKDWCKDPECDQHFIYVSGHTHRNFFYDDGVYRVYSDNQVGYHNESPHLKEFSIDNDYDCFADYCDGIYEITNQQYIDFYRGKNIPMSFHRTTNVLYMLKRNGYYCFIHKSKNGSLTIMNGGSMKKLDIKDVHYYYDNMEAMISTIQSPLGKYTSFQNHISKLVQQIGGTGTIHGCIVDIDFCNHIYVNPFDLSTTGYWASDIITKIVYPSIPALLEEHCPKIFHQYTKQLEGTNCNLLLPKQEAPLLNSPQLYLDTDIYKASRQIKKMQRLYSNILSVWHEKILQKKPSLESI